jgi:hypothetical protein
VPDQLGMLPGARDGRRRAWTEVMGDLDLKSRFLVESRND